MTNIERQRQEIKNLAKLMHERRKSGEEPYILLLGAGASISSGCSSNKQIIKEIVKTYAKNKNLTWDDEIDEFYRILEQYRSDIHIIMDKYLEGRGLSPGYVYLSKLIRDGYFNIIFSTNFDPLLEDSLGDFVKTTGFKVIIRGEKIETNCIEDILEFKTPRVKIVKLHGDLNARIFYIKPEETASFPENLESILKNYFDHNIIIVGHRMADLDIIKCIRSNASGSIWYINPTVPLSHDLIKQALSARSHTIISGECGKFDEFFFNLDYEINKLKLEEFYKDSKGKKIIETPERGDNYINSTNTLYLIEILVDKIKNEFSPNLIVVIRDPEVPGGPALWKNIKNYFDNVEMDEIKIEGRKGKRKITKSPEKIRNNQRQRILILDSISFSGKTIEIALKKIKKMSNNRAEIKVGVLVVSKRLIEMSERGEIGFGYNDLIYSKVIDRPEMFFPWGWIQATGDWERSFKGIGNEYKVKWIKRPWGYTEVFAENERCSIKIHTMEAGECLSLQRHINRDEFYIPLDNDIGVQIGEKVVVIEKGDQILIPRGTWHRFYAYKERGRVLEVAFGWYDQVRDIERLEDKYDRVNRDGSV
ncbi:MAG: cupin domain-containing protein [Candidatus Methanoperedens sp.]|nr:cupin domain-containing protein [Candidatus Methanoperedens sp.]